MGRQSFVRVGLVPLLVSLILLLATGTVFAAKTAPDGDVSLPYPTAVTLGQPGEPGPAAYAIAQRLHDAESPARSFNKIAITPGGPSAKAYATAAWLRAKESPNHTR
jgi:hypothetical protein